MNIKTITEKVIGNQVLELNGGLRNKCYICEDGEKVYFVKMYNREVMYSRHMSECRCVSEFFITQYLYNRGCPVAQPLYYDVRSQIGIYEYIEAKNLFDYGKIDFSVCKKVIESISTMHKIPVKTKIGNCKFVPQNGEDIYRYICDSLNFLAELCDVKFRVDTRWAKKISNYIAQSETRWGNQQLHNGNILINDEGKIFFCDFEKIFPHFPQLDLISFLKAREISVTEEKELLKYYLLYNNITNHKYFMDVYDLLFIIDSLRVLKKIYMNQNGLKVVWIEEKGERKKEYQKADSTIGLKWNEQRKESIDVRIKGIFNKVYSDNDYSNYMRCQVYKLLEKGKRI